MKSWIVAGALGTVVAGLFVGAVACSSDGGTVLPPAKDTGTPDTTSTDTGPIGDTGTIDDTGSTGDTPGEVGPPACPSVLKEGKIAELFDPGSSKVVAVGDGLKVTGVIATSIKFIVSKSSTAGGTCLYGVYVADANVTFLPYSGTLLVSKGNPASAGDGGGTFCSNGDLIPDDVKPGDVITAAGTFSPFGPTSSTCGGAKPPVPVPTPAKGNQVASLCLFTRTGTSTKVGPADVTPADIEDGSASLAKWQGGFVRLKNVKATSATAPGDSPSSYGNFKVEGSTKLQIGDKIYYRGAATAPTVKIGDVFTEISGMPYLDFCTWSLEPTSICDLKPVPSTSATCP